MDNDTSSSSTGDGLWNITLSSSSSGWGNSSNSTSSDDDAILWGLNDWELALVVIGVLFICAVAAGILIKCLKKAEKLGESFVTGGDGVGNVMNPPRSYCCCHRSTTGDGDYRKGEQLYLADATHIADSSSHAGGGMGAFETSPDDV